MKKVIFTHVLTLLLGGGIGYLVAKKMLEDQYAELAQEEIDDVKAFYELKLDRAMASSEENGMTEEEYEATLPPKSDADKVRELHKEGYTVTEIADALQMLDSSVQDLLETTKKPSVVVRPDNVRPGAKVAYHDMAKEALKEQLGIGIGKSSIEHYNVFDKQPESLTDAAGYAEGEIEGEPAERDLSDIDRTQPYVISSEEYNDEFIHHDKLSIYYYILDDVLCDEHEQPMDDIAGTIGYDCFKILENQSAAWVRNERLAIDYEICVVRSSYAEVVQGIPAKILSPREAYQKKQVRRGNVEE